MVDVVVRKKAIGLVQYQRLPHQLRQFFILHGEQASRLDSRTSDQRLLLTLFQKYFDCCDLLSMDKRSFWYQTFAGPPDVQTLASEDLAPFYRKHFWDDSYVAKYISRADVAELRVIKEFTARSLQEVWTRIGPPPMPMPMPTN
jgi:hypothetical protein